MLTSVQSAGVAPEVRKNASAVNRRQLYDPCSQRKGRLPPPLRTEGQTDRCNENITFPRTTNAVLNLQHY